MVLKVKKNGLLFKPPRRLSLPSALMGMMAKGRVRNWLKNLLALGIGCLVALLIAEGILRVWSPLQNRVHGDRIRLIANMQRTILPVEDEGHPGHKGLDSIAYYSTNSLGLRGPEPEADTTLRKIIAVGGSTTECRVLSDGDTWPAKLGDMLRQKGHPVWVNNAGIDGTSTFGHQLLLEDHLLQMQPDIILFLVGVNDLSQTELQSGDRFLQEGHRHTMRRYMQHSEVFNLLITLYRANRAQHYGLHNPTAADTARLSVGEVQHYDSLHAASQQGYTDRLRALADTCRSHDILPVFITQPAYRESIHRRFRYLDLYNQTLLQFAKAEGLPVIDLATELPDSDVYYYDFIHYTKPGAEKVGEIILPEIDKLLSMQPEEKTLRSPEQQ